jgi:hypothetical protein
MTNTTDIRGAKEVATDHGHPRRTTPSERSRMLSEAERTWERGRVPSASYKRKHAPKAGVAINRVEYTDVQCTWNYVSIHTNIRKSVVLVTPSETWTDNLLGRGLLIAEGDGVQELALSSFGRLIVRWLIG